MSDVTEETSGHEPEQHVSPWKRNQATNIIIKAVQNKDFKEDAAAIASVKPQSDNGRNSIKKEREN